MAIVEVQYWKQKVRDRAGNIVAERQVTMTPNASSVRQEANKFLSFILQNNGDVKLSVESELQILRSQMADFLKRMNSSRDEEEIRRLRAPMTITVALAPALEHLLEKSKSMTAGEFTAESLESEAARMPPSKKEEADTLRKAAQIYRELGSSRTVRVWEIPNEEFEVQKFHVMKTEGGMQNDLEEMTGRQLDAFLRVRLGHAHAEAALSELQQRGIVSIPYLESLGQQARLDVKRIT